MAASHRPTAVAGLLGVTLNMVAVIALRPVPDTYAPGDVPAWLAEARAVPVNIAIAGSAFTIGLVALAAFMAGLAFRGATRQSWWVIGASLCGAGALLDAAGTMAPVAALHTSDEVGIGLLWLTLVLDSSFNALLGFGLRSLSTPWARRLARSMSSERWSPSPEYSSRALAIGSWRGSNRGLKTRGTS